ncbi:MAG: Zn-dependent exopeptidase M28 [Thermoplasmatales archaeon]|nr:MAG: Zn-dependent exopeptidase M28 [Thermoplasmatales archaeon]
MKRTLIIIWICMLLITVLALPVSCLTMETNENLDYYQKFPSNIGNINYFDQSNNVRDPPIPGHMSTPYPEFNTQTIMRIDPEHHELMPLSYNDNVVFLIQQLNEEMILQYLENLTSFGPRVTGSPECYDAGDYIYNEFQNTGLDVRFHNWSYEGYTDRNVEATLHGINESSDEIYIICAHFDSVSGSPGADDDGSGVAAVMSAAYIMSQYELNHTVRFVAFSGEEQGLYGSYMYVQEANGNGDNIVAVLNVDMIGFAITSEDGNSVKVYFNDASGWLVDYTAAVSNQYDEYINLDVLYSGYSWSSDHYSFWLFNYDAIFYHEYEFNPYYHSSQDIIENLNVTYSMKCTKLVLATLAALTLPSGKINMPPKVPTINGPTQGIVGEEYEYSFVSIDPEGSDVYYYIKWGDGQVEEWIGPYNSGEEINVAHVWSKQGIHSITTKAKDINDSESRWAVPYSVTIVAVEIIDINGGLGVTAKLENIAKINVIDIDWSISVTGGFLGLIDKTKSGIITHMSAGETIKVKTRLFFGFGLLYITVTADTQTMDTTGFIFGPLVIIT